MNLIVGATGMLGGEICRLLEMKPKWLRLRAVAADGENAHDEGKKGCLDE